MSLLTEILRRAAVEQRPHPSKPDEIMLCCPFCSERGLSDDRSFHLGINVENGKSHCFRCGWSARDALWAARQLSRAFNVPFRLRYVLKSEHENVSGTVNESAYYEKVSARENARPLGLPREYEAFNGSEDSVERKLRAYLTKRGVSASQITRHKIGYAAVGDLAWRILFPVFGKNGRVYGTVGRVASDNVQPKYLNTRGIKLLWGAHMPGHTAVIVEGVFDALRVEQALLRRRSTVALARLGSTITPAQLKQLKKYEQRIILPDWDVPGVRGAMKLAQTCADNHLPVKIAVPGEMSGLDPGSMTLDQIDAAIDAALPWGEGVKFRLRMAMV